MKRIFTRAAARFLLMIFILTAVVSCSRNGVSLLPSPGSDPSPETSAATTGQAPTEFSEKTHDVSAVPSVESGETPSSAVDNIPPFLVGNDVQIEIGTEINYAALVFFSDDRTDEPRLEIDSSAVNPDADGVYPVHYTVYDDAGNTASLTINVTVKDTIPPTIKGEDFSVKAGGTVSYKNKVTVTDNHDPSPVLTIDNSTVDLDKPGTYAIIYTATDASGNRTVLTLKLKVLGADDLPDDTPEAKEQYVREKSREILAEITTPDMNDLQVAYAIYHWTKHKISYSGSSTKEGYVIGAYEGFKTRAGDCYTYYAVAKALLVSAGIQNVDMVKERINTKQARHYWLLVNVGDGWYHFDSTPYVFKESNFFMVTDTELKNWDDKYYRYCHNFLDENLPERATASIQYLINYHASTLTLPDQGSTGAEE